MTGYLLDDPAFMVGDKERKEKVDKVFSDVEQLQKESKLSDRYMYIIQLTIFTYMHVYEAHPYQGPVFRTLTLCKAL